MTKTGRQETERKFWPAGGGLIQVCAGTVCADNEPVAFVFAKISCRQALCSAVRDGRCVHERFVERREETGEHRLRVAEFAADPVTGCECIIQIDCDALYIIYSSLFTITGSKEKTKKTS